MRWSKTCAGPFPAASLPMTDTAPSRASASWKKPFAAACDFAPSSSASRRQSKRSGCCRNSAPRSRPCCFPTSSSPAPSPASTSGCGGAGALEGILCSTTCWQGSGRAAAGHCRSPGSGQPGHHPAFGGGLRSRRGLAGRGHGQPVQSQSGAGLGRFGISAARGAGEAARSSRPNERAAACDWWRLRRTKATPLDQAKLSGPLAIFIGSEGAGLSRDLIKEMDEVVAIPQSPQVESLNAGVAASIVLYEVARRRK